MGEKAAWRNSILYTYYERGMHDVALHYGVRDERYKLIHFPDTGEKEFYDLEADPQEMKNLFGSAEYAGKIDRMEGELSRLMEEYGLDNPLEYVKRLDQAATP